ncbi:aldo/keto reductase [Ideonella sp. DXS22W]|uniref:Aldo/keto reductase n=1 Tax=Pseudaquabacterium inlustre TaxID=2984192 RepID=A0ABU9CJM2_9BURK
MARMHNPAGLSPIVAGAWRLAEWGWTPQQRLAWIEANLDIGVSSFDHADIYGGYAVESLFGEALALQPALRQRIQLVSKCGIKLVSPARPGHAVKHYDTSAAHVRTSVEQSLRNLRTDHLDLLLIHRPDCLLDPDELADTFEALRREGKVRYFGVSNFTPSQLAPLHRRIALATTQIECSPLHLDPLHDGTLDQCVDLGLRPMIWSPLAGGRVFTGQDERAQRVRGTVQAMAHELGIAPITLISAWLRRHPSQPLPILGSRRIDVAREAMAALNVTLDAQQWYRLWEAAAGREVP